jgi:ubiquinone/menaquinone biosynthesis C-methylase UbiE
MKIKDVIKVYNAIAPDYEKAFPEQNRHLDDFISLLPPKQKILDIGCGTGNNAIPLAKHKHKVVGIDLSDSMLDLASKREIAGIQYIKMDISKMNFNANSFDNAIADCSLCYLPKSDVLPTLKNIHKVLKQNGLLFLVLQEGKTAEISLPEPLNPKLKLDVNVMSEKEIYNLLEQSGFKVIKSFSQDKDDITINLDFKELTIIAKKV